MSQQEQVLAMLRSAGADGLCSLDLYRSALPNGRNRIGELERDRGFVIESRPCHQHDHGKTAYFRYFIRHDPERQPEQLRAAI